MSHPTCKTHGIPLDDRDCQHCQDGHVEPEDDFDFHSTTCWRCNGTGVLKSIECYMCEHEFAEEQEREREEERFQDHLNNGRGPND